MKKIIVICMSLFVAACLTTQVQQTKPLEEPLQSKMPGKYFFQSPIDPAEFVDGWELVKKEFWSHDPYWGDLHNIYKKNPNRNGAFLYVKYLTYRDNPCLAYVLVAYDMRMHTYILHRPINTYVLWRDQQAAAKYHKPDLDRVFGIETIVENPKDSGTPIGF